MRPDNPWPPERRFSVQPAPRLTSARTVGGLMRGVLLALVPGILLQSGLSGPGVLIQCAIASLAALAAEAAVLTLRGRRLAPALRDGSAVVTGVLLGLAVPGLAPWWLAALGAGFAILFGKQVYGGLGHNPFNPAMAGYAMLLIAFPKLMTAWPGPLALLPSPAGLTESLQAIFQGLPDARLDALAMATPLDAIRTTISQGRALTGMGAGMLAAGTGKTGLWANLGFLLGGLWLLRHGIIDWRIPAGVLAGLSLPALVFCLADPEVYPAPLFHLLTGATMLAAFFIATDPVSAATTPRGRLLFGLGVGGLIYVIRTWGGYPDGVAFAVLLMNLVAPTLDLYTRSRVYGHSR
jgi:electron transport complex protein RnfD